MHCVIVTFRLDGVADAAFREQAATAAPAFADVPGLGLKLWLAEPETGTYGGVYLFESRARADEYLQSDLFTDAVIANPRFVDVTIRRAAVLEEPTAHTSGSLRAPLATA